MLIFSPDPGTGLRSKGSSTTSRGIPREDRIAEKAMRCHHFAMYNLFEI